MRPDARIGLVESVDFDLDIVPQNAAARAVARETKKRSKRVRWNRRAKPLDNITFIVVMRRFHEHERKTASLEGRRSRGHSRRLTARSETRRVILGNPLAHASQNVAAQRPLPR